MRAQTIFFAGALSAAVLSAAGLAGCARPAPHAEPAGPVAAAGQGAAARVIPWPDCARFDFPEDGGGDTGCQLQTGAGLLRVTIAPAPAGGDADFTLTARLIGPADGVAQTIEAGLVGRVFTPEAKDLTGDGAADLLITTDVGNVNAVRSVYLFDAKTAKFVEAGEISGTGIERLPDGLLAVSARSSADSYVVEYYSVRDNKLVAVASADVELAASGKVKGCTVTPPEGGPANFNAVNLTPAQANAKFCAHARAEVEE